MSNDKIENVADAITAMKAERYPEELILHIEESSAVIGIQDAINKASALGMKITGDLKIILPGRIHKIDAVINLYADEDQ